MYFVIGKGYLFDDFFFIVLLLLWLTLERGIKERVLILDDILGYSIYFKFRA